MSLVILFHFLCAQHVSDINVSISSSLRLFCWITTLVVLFLARCVLEFRCGWFGVVSVLQAEASACNTDTTPNQPPRNSNTHRTKNNTTNMVIQQHSRKLLMMDILMSESCWAHEKWNKITSDIKLVFYSSTITMMHGPINIRFTYIIFNNFPPPPPQPLNSCHLWDNVEKYCSAGQATDDITAHPIACRDNYGFKNTHRICNNYFFSTATVVARTHSGVTSHVHCLSSYLTQKAKILFFPLNIDPNHFNY